MKKLSLCFLLFIFVMPILADDKWSKVEFQNFTVIGSGSESQLKKVGNKLEQFRQTLSILIPKSKLNSSLPTIVYAFASFDDFQSYLAKTKDKKSIGGLFSSRAEANYIVLPIEGRGRDVYEVIYHEYFHYVMNKNLRNAPLWLNEGLAEYYSTFEINDEGTKVKLGLPLKERVLDLRDRPFIPLATLFEVNHNSPEYNEQSKAGVFYAESWALIHFLNQGNEGKRQPQFNKFTSLILNGISPKEAFQTAFQSDYNQIEKELRQYINQFTFPAVEYTFNQQISWEKTAKVINLSEAETKTAQANLYFLFDRNTDAEKNLFEAIKLNPDLAESYQLLGKVKARQKKYSEARNNFEKALLLQPNDYLNNYYFASFLRNESKFDEAIKYFKESIKLKADIPRLHATLGRLNYDLYRDTEAIESYNQALKLDNSESDYFFILGQLLLRNNKNYLASVRAKNYITLEGWSNDTAAYAALIMYYGYQRENVVERADEILKIALEKVDKKDWIHAVFRYLNKEIDERELLLNAAGNLDKQTEAYCYIGLNLLMQSKTEEAKEKLQWVKNNGNKNFIEYGYALKELERLESTKQPAK